MIRTKFLVEFFCAQKIVFVVVEKTIWSRIKAQEKMVSKIVGMINIGLGKRFPHFLIGNLFPFEYSLLIFVTFLWEDIIQSYFSLNISIHEVPWPHLVGGLS